MSVLVVTPLIKPTPRFFALFEKLLRPLSLQATIGDIGILIAGRSWPNHDRAPQSSLDTPYLASRAVSRLA